MDSERKSEIQNVRRSSCIVAAWNSHVLRYLEKFRGLWEIEGVKWKYLLPYYSTRNVTAFRELWPPNVNVSFPNWDAPTNHHHHGDCWEAGGMNARSKVNKKTGWPQIMRCMWKGWIQWSQRLASSHIQNAKFLNLIPDLWCSDCLLPLLQTWDPWFPFLPPWSFQGTEMLSSRLGILNMPTKKKEPSTFRMLSICFSVDKCSFPPMSGRKIGNSTIKKFDGDANLNQYLDCSPKQRLHWSHAQISDLQNLWAIKFSVVSH